jgi:hypothetical protein
MYQKWFGSSAQKPLAADVPRVLHSLVQIFVSFRRQNKEQ